MLYYVHCLKDYLVVYRVISTVKLLQKVVILTNSTRSYLQIHENKTSEIGTIFHGNDYQKG